MDRVQQIRVQLCVVHEILERETNWHLTGIPNDSARDRPKDKLLKYAYDLIREEQEIRSMRGY